MSPFPEPRRVTGVVHPCLTVLPRPFPLAGARLTDRAKAGVLLQAAGLLSLLERAGWRLAAGWEGARVSAAGEMAIEAEPGRSTEPAQELLRDLVVRLFGAETVPGRGEARRAVRTMLDAWRQTVAPLPADETVRGILEAGLFLWEPDLAFARRCLAGGLIRDGEARPLVAGPRPFRRRLLALRPALPDLWDLLSGPEARSLWNREEEGEPLDLAALGRWRAAVAAWERRPPATEEERIGRAAALASLGRFEAALDGLSGLGSPAARALAARCQLDLLQLGAARNTLKSLEDVPLEPERVAELAEIAARVHANRGEPDRAGFWIRRALDETTGTGSPALRTRLAAAGAAWDRRDFDAMGRLLDHARGALAEPDLAWRWHQLQALHARSADLPDAAEHAARALRAGRRRLTRRQAAGLWNDLGLARAAQDDLPGAERAFLHAARLEAGCDGPRKATLAFFNLAEIRLRRGRTAGVREIIARAEEENRRSGNLRGLREDAGLWARFELALGRPAAALAVCREALRDLDHDWYREELHLFAARALGWLGSREEAAAELAHVPEETLRELEPEERPAVRALAGDRAGALREAAGASCADLWERLLSDEPVPAPRWEPLASLEPYRAARLVFDAEALVPGAAPALWRRTAAATFRKTGAVPLAEILEARDGGPWIVFAACLAALRGLTAESGPPAPPEEPAPERGPGGIVGESPALRSAIDRMNRLAPGDLPVLILGESGTGKELAARQIHRVSARAGGPFVAVNCAALSETLLLSDLFGHVRGAFTGAERDRKGVFETASGGTVFLDEIGDLPLSAQGLLLRVLQEGEIRRLGESEPRRVNVRVLAATHRDLLQMAEAGTFRLDLFYRLRVGCVELPPLRERGEDVLLIADHILARLRGPRNAWLSREARALLIVHTWPGNVRELQNVLSVAATLAGFGRIDPEHLEMPRGEEPHGIAESKAASSYHQQVEAFRRGLVTKALDDNAGQHTAAARQLGLSRQTFSYLVRRFGLASPRRNDQLSL